MALMYEVLALQTPVDHEAEDRARQIAELKVLVRDKHKKGQGTRSIKEQLRKLENVEDGARGLTKGNGCAGGEEDKNGKRK